MSKPVSVSIRTSANPNVWVIVVRRHGQISLSIAAGLGEEVAILSTSEANELASVMCPPHPESVAEDDPGPYIPPAPVAFVHVSVTSEGRIYGLDQRGRLWGGGCDTAGRLHWSMLPMPQDPVE
jgi:hypothetical protein